MTIPKGWPNLSKAEYNNRFKFEDIFNQYKYGAKAISEKYRRDCLFAEEILSNFKPKEENDTFYKIT